MYTFDNLQKKSVAALWFLQDGNPHANYCVGGQTSWRTRPNIFTQFWILKIPPIAESYVVHKRQSKICQAPK